MDLRLTEVEYGKLARMLAANLVKNAADVPAVLKDAAIAYEDFSWHPLTPDEKLSRVQTIARETGEGTSVAAHFEAYPLPYSKKLYQRYLAAQQEYLNALAAE